MSDPTIAEELAAYAVDLRSADIDERTAEQAKVRIVDSLASTLGAVRLSEPAVEQIVDFCATQSRDEDATILGTGRRAAVEYAAFANASTIRYLDWNDYHAAPNRHGVLSIGHASSNLGALLTVAEAAESSGEDLLVATVLAYELHLRMADETAQYDDGLDHVNYGLVASTLAAGRLRGLTEDELAQAANIAIVGNLSLYQSRCGELTEWKGFAFGNTARNALVAVDLAAAGIHGPAPIFEGKAGLSNLLSHPIELDTSSFGGRGGDYRLHGTNLKPYPVCGALQRPLDDVFELLEEHAIDWRDIEEIEVHIAGPAIELTAAEPEKWDPQNRNTADHSLPYCIARAFIDEAMGLEQFTDEKILDPEVRELMDAISVIEDEEDALVRVATGAGTVVSAVEHPRGHHQRPFTESELAGKLGSAMGVPAEHGSVQAILGWTDELEAQPSVAELAELVRMEASGTLRTD